MGQKRSKNIVPFGHSEGTWVLRRYLKHSGTQSTWTLKHSSSTWALKALYLANSWKSFNHTIQLCTQTLYTLSISFCLHSSLSPESEWEEWERVIDFAARILDLPLIWRESICPYGDLITWACFTIIRKNHILFTDVSAWLVSFKNNPLVVLFVLKTVFMKPMVKFYELIHYGE